MTDNQQKVLYEVVPENEVPEKILIPENWVQGFTMGPNVWLRPVAALSAPAGEREEDYEQSDSSRLAETEDWEDARVEERAKIAGKEFIKMQEDNFKELSEEGSHTPQEIANWSLADFISGYLAGASSTTPPTGKAAGVWFDMGAAAAYECVKPDGPCDFDSELLAKRRAEALASAQPSETGEGIWVNPEHREPNESMGIAYKNAKGDIGAMYFEKNAEDNWDEGDMWLDTSKVLEREGSFAEWCSRNGWEYWPTYPSNNTTSGKSEPVWVKEENEPHKPLPTTSSLMAEYQQYLLNNK